jgi:hypothetical protein
MAIVCSIDVDLYGVRTAMPLGQVSVYFDDLGLFARHLRYFALLSMHSYSRKRPC